MLLSRQGGGGDEDDGYDETIIPLDFRQSGQIRDDDLFRVLVSPMAAGVTMTCLMDSCHSGTVLDLPYRYTATGSKMYRNEKFKSRRLQSSTFVWLNLFNVLAYLANAAVTYGVGALGLFGTATNGELSETYQTLVTPVGWAFGIWAIIFILQLIWAIAQLVVPSLRGAVLVRNGVGWYYIGVCLAQIGWTIAFSYEIIWLSLVAMLSILFFLIRIVVAQYNVQRTVSLCEYWLLKFPFAIHAGWILAASFVNLNVLFVDLEFGADAQYYAALASLTAVLVIAGFVLAYPTPPELVIPLVLAWATVRILCERDTSCQLSLMILFRNQFGIYVELDNPKDVIVNTFDSSMISVVQYGSIIVCGLILFLTATAAILACCRRQSRHLDEGGYKNMTDV
jgi:Caspase domain